MFAPLDMVSPSCAFITDQAIGCTYCMQPETHTLVMLCGGGKSSQTRDIEQARTIAKDWKGVKNG